MSDPQPQPIKSFLAERRMTVRALARHIGRNEHHLGRVINGRYRVSPELAAEVAAALGQPPDTLFRRVDVGPPLPHPGDQLLSAQPLDGAA